MSPILADMSEFGTAEILGGLTLLIWIGLMTVHGGFWRFREVLPPPPDTPQPPSAGRWPSVAIIVPARNEADVIAEAAGSLLAQDYPGHFRLIVIDDNSTDGTAAALPDDPRLSVVSGSPRPEGWAGKVWAMQQGLDRMRRLEADDGHRFDRVLFTDADIGHPPDSLRRLVAFALSDRRDMVSLMVRLAAGTPFERLLIPAFVLFFSKLYPFARANNPGSRIAAAAGGCMLVDRDVLDRSGAMASIHDRLIDDCALARAIADHGSGRIWLGLGMQHRSLRGYSGLGGVWRMVARTAFTQLRHSAWLLAGTVIGMALIYLTGPALALFGDSSFSRATGAAAWVLMAVSFVPILRRYHQPVLLAPLLPFAGFLYTLMTIDSARLHYRGRGGAWKGRTYDRSADGTGLQTGKDPEQE